MGGIFLYDLGLPSRTLSLSFSIPCPIFPFSILLFFPLFAGYPSLFFTLSLPSLSFPPLFPTPCSSTLSSLLLPLFSSLPFPPQTTYIVLVLTTQLAMTPVLGWLP